MEINFTFPDCRGDSSSKRRKKKNQGTQKPFRSSRFNYSRPLDYQIFLGFLEGFSYILVQQHTKEEILVVGESPLTTHSPKEGGMDPFMLHPCHTKSFFQSWSVLRTGDQDCCDEHLSYSSIQRPSFHLDQSFFTSTAVLHPTSSHPRRATDFVLLFLETSNYNH